MWRTQKLQILKFQNLKTFKNSETLLRSLKFVIHQNNEQDAITVSNLVRNWNISTQISCSCRNVANWGYSKSAPTYQLLKAQKCINHDGYWYHLKQFILASGNSYCNFHILFIYYVLYFPLQTSTLYFPCFRFFFIDRNLKQVLSIRAIHPCFVKDRSSVS